MPEANTEFERLLTQRANRSLGQLCNLVDRGSGLGMSAKLFHVGFGIFTANGFLFSFLGQLSLLDLLKRPSNTRDLLGNQSRLSTGLPFPSIREPKALFYCSPQGGLSGTLIRDRIKKLQRGEQSPGSAGMPYLAPEVGYLNPRARRACSSKISHSIQQKLK
jgi:hypothetical protein